MLREFLWVEVKERCHVENLAVGVRLILNIYLSEIGWVGVN
jgi:hypothetical protein